MRLITAVIFSAALLFGARAFAATPVAATPPMGWNSWNFFADKVSDPDVRAAADALVSSGMRDAGYVYVNIDDGWQGARDANGAIQPNAHFPDMKALADYVRARGLKLGLYSSPGSKTCGGYTGSLGHETQDARRYADWGVDYLKYDLCSYIQDVMQAQAPRDPDRQMQLMIGAYRRMHAALKATGRPIVFSLCQYGWDAPWEWATGTDIGGNLWRTTGDITPEWDRIYAIATQQAGLAAYAGPGHWNDPDMLEVGNGKLTPAENRAHFSWWAMLAAPLLAGNDLAHMTPATRAILTQRAVIAIDQDPLGQQATRAYADGEIEVWTRPLQGGALALAIFNVGSDRHAGSHPMHLSLSRLGLKSGQPAHDLWSNQVVTLVEGMPIAMQRHDVMLLRIDAPVAALPPR
jgi:alpha-galactosidase